MKRFTNNQVQTAAADLARLLSKSQIQNQISYYNQPQAIDNYAQLDDLYIHQAALKFKD